MNIPRYVLTISSDEWKLLKAIQEAIKNGDIEEVKLSLAPISKILQDRTFKAGENKTILHSAITKYLISIILQEKQIEILKYFVRHNPLLAEDLFIELYHSIPNDRIDIYKFLLSCNLTMSRELAASLIGPIQEDCYTLVSWHERSNHYYPEFTLIIPIPIRTLRLESPEHTELRNLSKRIDNYYNDLTLSYQKENFGQKSIKTKIQKLPDITNSKQSPNQYISTEDFLAYIIYKLPEIEDKFGHDIDFTLKRILCKYDIRSFCNIATISNIKSYLLFAEKYGIEIAKIAVQYPEIVFIKEILEDKLNLIPDITHLICMNLGNNHESVRELLIGISGDVTQTECSEQ